MIRRLGAAAMVVLVAGALLVAALDSRPESTYERAQRLADQIRCPVCDGASVADRPSSTARAMADDITGRVEQGQADDQILAAYAERYGEWILLEPNHTALTFASTWGPWIALGAVAAVTVQRRRVRADRQAAPAPANETADPAVHPAPVRTRGVPWLPLAVGAAVVTAVVAAVVVGTNVRGGGGAAEPASLAEAVEERPDDPRLRLAHARQLLADGDYAAALEAYDAAASLDPTNVEAATFSGWIAFLGGFPDEALSRLDDAVELDPTYPDAHVFRGIVLLRGAADPVAAAAELETYLRLAPQGAMRGEVEQLLARAHQQMANLTESGTGDDS